jgi:hypothetical protein
MRLLGRNTPTLKSSSVKLKNSSYRKVPSTVRQANQSDIGMSNTAIAVNNNLT